MSRAYRRRSWNTDLWPGWADERGVWTRSGDDAVDPAGGRGGGVRVADHCCDPGAADDCVLQLPADDCGVSEWRGKLYGCVGKPGGEAGAVGGSSPDD